MKIRTALFGLFFALALAGCDKCSDAPKTCVKKHCKEQAEACGPICRQALACMAECPEDPKPRECIYVCILHFPQNELVKVGNLLECFDQNCRKEPEHPPGTIHVHPGGITVY